MTAPASAPILLIDDEEGVRQVLRHALQAHGFETVEALSGGGGIKKAMSARPALILLDLGLPDMHGIETLRAIRKWSTTPVIVLTVSDDEATKISLLDAGADDYITKPFSTPELLARVRVALRHRDSAESTPIFESGDLKVDLVLRTVTVAGRAVKLTSTEFEFLRVLVKNAGRVVTQSTLLTEVWGSQQKDQTHYVRIYASQLRKKIEADPTLPRHVLTEPGVGYRLV